MDFKKFSLMVEQTKASLFADFLSQGKIMGTRCRQCGAEYYPPQMDCPACLTGEMEWFECPSEGTIDAFTQINVLPEHFAMPTPSIPFGKATLTSSPVGLLRVKDGIRIMGWVPDASADDITIGDRMEAHPEALDDGRITIVLKKIEQQ